MGVRPPRSSSIPERVRTLVRGVRAKGGALAARLRVRPPVGFVRLGSLRRTTPISDEWGYDRGSPIDRRYIEGFLGEHRADIRGHVLEIREPGYTYRFGTAVERSDVLDIDAGNPVATIVADLADAPGVADDTFDCVIVTQTFQLIYDVRRAVATAHRVLKPGGVLLATVPGITPIATEASEDHWRFTAASASRVFGDVFGGGRVEVSTYGNVLSGAAFLYGLADRDLRPSEMTRSDPRYPVVVAIRAVKGTTP